MKPRKPKTRDAYQLDLNGKTAPKRMEERLEISIARNGIKTVESIGINEQLSKLHKIK